MTIASATEVRGNFSDVLGRVAYGKERVTIERRGRPMAALVPIEDLERLENGANDRPGSAEEALRRRKEDFDLVANNIPVLISFVDRNGRFRFANKVYEDWYGVPQDEIAGSHLRDVIGETRYRSIEAELAKVLNGQRMRYESSVSFGEGTDRYLSAEWIPHTDDNGETDGFVALVQDITDRSMEALTSKMR